MAPVDLRLRTTNFSRMIIRFVKTIDLNIVSKPILSQLMKSATSIGANFTEAKDASSKRDFRNKVFISKKEASETLYWLNLMDELTVNKEVLDILKSECQELILILQKIVNTTNYR